MKNFDLMRREFLRTGGLGAAAATIPSLSSVTAKSSNEESSSAAQGIFDVRKHGATGDGRTLDTDAINRAIEGAAGSGGGLVYFPPGKYLSFSIHLRSGVHLHLEQGCTIVAAESP